MKIILLIIGIILAVVSGMLETREKTNTRSFICDLIYGIGSSLCTIVILLWLGIISVSNKSKSAELLKSAEIIQVDTINDTTYRATFIYHATNRKERNNNK